MATKKPKSQHRKPPGLVAAQQFIAGGDAPPKPRDGRTTIYTRKTGESAGEDLRRVTLYFPAELHKRARIAAVEADTTLSEFVVVLVAKALGDK
mgnify:CR=1 FL=1